MASLTAPNLGEVEGSALIVAGVIALVVVVYVVRKASPSQAKDADGNPVTAYQNAGPIGVAGAAANAASGGWLATFGNWIGTKVGDATIDDPNADANQAAADKAAAAAALQALPVDYGSVASNPYGW
jgi:hypothetical protein